MFILLHSSEPNKRNTPLISVNEINNLYKKFYRVDKDKDGLITLDKLANDIEKTRHVSKKRAEGLARFIYSVSASDSFDPNNLKDYDLSELSVNIGEFVAGYFLINHENQIKKYFSVDSLNEVLGGWKFHQHDFDGTHNAILNLNAFWLAFSVNSFAIKDTNHNGELSKQENNNSIHLIEDLNNNGKISIGENIATYNDLILNGHFNTTNVNFIEKHLKEFNELDKNKDGKLSIDERGNISKNKFEELDLNGNEKLSKTEYLWPKLKKQIDPDNVLNSAFGGYQLNFIDIDFNNNFDDNNDSFITAGEADEEFIRRYDKNNDGKLSYAEYLAGILNQEIEHYNEH